MCEFHTLEKANFKIQYNQSEKYKRQMVIYVWACCRCVHASWSPAAVQCGNRGWPVMAVIVGSTLRALTFGSGTYLDRADTAGG